MLQSWVSILIWCCTLMVTVTVVHAFNFGRIWDQKLALVDNFSGKKASNGKINTVAITGASGLLGTALKQSLLSKNINVISITSKKSTTQLPNTLVWNIEKKELDSTALEGVDAIIHLAGEGVASGEGPLAILGRWSPNKKNKILQSRIQSTQLIVETISKLKKKPKVFISASAVGIYPYTNNEDVTYSENSITSPPATTATTVTSNTIKSDDQGFLMSVCQQWETEALKAQKYNVRTVCCRFGVILSGKGGLLQKLLPIFQLGTKTYVLRTYECISHIHCTNSYYYITICLHVRMHLNTYIYIYVCVLINGVFKYIYMFGCRVGWHYRQWQAGAEYGVTSGRSESSGVRTD